MTIFTQFFAVSTIRKLHEKYEAHLSAGAVLLGFTIDALTLTRIDLLYDNLVLAFYLVVAASAIIIMNLYREGKLRARIFEHADWWVPLVMQFAFGGMASALLIFYGRAGSFSASWPLFLFLLGLLVGNEFLRTRYQRLTFHVSMLFIALYGYMIFAIPMLFNRMGVALFLLSGVVSIVLISGFIRLIQFGSPRQVQKKRTILTAITVGVFMVGNVLYVANIIPPIPLSLKEGRVAHSIVRTSEGYQLQKEERSLIWRILPGETIHITPGQSLYFYSAVFAPTDLNVDIVHEWQYFDRDKSRWAIVTEIAFPIFGGRDDGYRGYSIKDAPREGLWRVSVETPEGLVLGRDRFRVRYTDTPPRLQSVMK